MEEGYAGEHYNKNMKKKINGSKLIRTEFKFFESL